MSGPSSSPSGVVKAELGADEAQLGSTPASAAANTALRALSRAARAFTMYDSKNVIIRRFLGEYRDALEQVVNVHGALRLEVRPFELQLGTETVYREDDRERSLAFRLFRDGVRTVTIRPGLPWEECVRLLEILSVRYSGVRQQEDDLVTLLRRASFTCIDFTAVEGFTPAEEQPEAAPVESSARREGLAVHAPPDFDLPLPEVAPVAYGYREVPPAWLESLRTEERAGVVPALAARLAIVLLREANGPASLLSNTEVAPLCAEVRDYCLADGSLLPLLALVRELKAHHGIGVELLAGVLMTTASRETIAKLFEAVPAEAIDPPPGLIELLAELPGNHVTETVERLNETEDPRLQRIYQGVLVGLGKRSSDSLIAALPVATASSASQIVSALMITAPDHVLKMAGELVGRDDREAHLQALNILERAGRSDAQSELLVKLAGNADPEVFSRAAHVLASSHDRRGYDVLARQADARASAKSLTPAMATAVGEALAALSPLTAMQLFKGWLEPKAGLLGKVSERDAQLQFAAVAGMAMIRLDDAESLIKALHASTTNEALKQHCVSAMSRRRRMLTGAPHAR